VGDLGQSAFEFVDQLQDANQSYWQILPLNPVTGHGSPYSSHSLFAGNPLLVSPERLVEEGLLPSLPDGAPQGDPSKVDYESALAFKDRLLERAYQFGYPRLRNDGDFLQFRAQNVAWLEDFALYDALSRENPGGWLLWSEEIRRRNPAALDHRRELLRPAVERAVFDQYFFHRQWSALHAYSKSKGVSIIGDLPFYVLHDSSDVWVHPELFRLDASGKSAFVGGVPPDYFSSKGQRWGNPLYDWRKMEETGYRWWTDRMNRSLELFDLVRLDHFRGYVAHWEVPVEEETAVKGRWVETPKSFLASLKQNFPGLPFLAEDLGEITDDVKEAIDALGIPGMKVLLFAFDGTPTNPYLPVNHPRSSLVYTGTHDTNTTLGWFRDEAGSREREALLSYLGRAVTEESVCDEFLGMAMGSAAELCIVPIQDLIGLGSEARMNDPSTAFGNWQWRVLPRQLSGGNLPRLAEVTAANGRA
jgi:4-alpha-glucanotransferase